MKYQITKLKNGLRIVTSRMPQSPSATVSVMVGAGSRYENYQRNGGVSHFLEHLFFKGTESRPSTKVISEEIDAVGGASNAYTGHELTNYYVRVPKEHIPLALEILADMMQNSLFESAEIDRERGVVLEEMTAYRDDPASYVWRLIPPLLWPKDTIKHDILGNDKVIKTITRRQVVAFKNRFYSSSNMVISAAGNVNHDKIVEEAERLFGNLKSFKAPRLTKVKAGLSNQAVTVQSKKTNQAHFVLASRAYPYRHGNDPAAKVITYILGRGLSSRLFLNVRERLGLAYSVGADLNNFIDTGEFAVYAGVNLDKIELALTAVMAELNRMRTEPVHQGELAKAKNQIRGRLAMALESNANVSDYLGRQLVLMPSIRPVEEFFAEIDAVTAEDVQRVADAILKPSGLRLGIIAPRAKADATRLRAVIDEGSR